MKKLRIVMGIIVLIIGIAMLIGGMSVVDDYMNGPVDMQVLLGIIVGLSPLPTSFGIGMLVWDKL